MYLGIDPGINGSIVVVNAKGDYVDHLNMPFITKIKKSSKQREKKIVNTLLISKFIDKYPIKKAFIEKVNAMPNQGVVAMFSFGHALGSIEGLILAKQIDYQEILPSRWKGQYDFINKDKDAPRITLLNVLTDVADIKLKAKGQALADAYYIANYGLTN